MSHMVEGKSPPPHPCYGTLIPLLPCVCTCTCVCARVHVLRNIWVSREAKRGPWADFFANEGLSSITKLWETFGRWSCSLACSAVLLNSSYPPSFSLCLSLGSENHPYSWLSRSSFRLLLIPSLVHYSRSHQHGFAQSSHWYRPGKPDNFCRRCQRQAKCLPKP